MQSGYWRPCWLRHGAQLLSTACATDSTDLRPSWCAALPRNRADEQCGHLKRARQRHLDWPSHNALRALATLISGGHERSGKVTKSLGTGKKHRKYRDFLPGPVTRRERRPIARPRRRSNAEVRFDAIYDTERLQKQDGISKV